jgi:hypothetical protein
MKKYYKKTLLYCFALLSSGFFCTDLRVTGGSSSTDNGKICGVIYQENGLPAGRTQVVLRPSGFDPYHDTSLVLTDTTDTKGSYEFTSVGPGSYTLEAIAFTKEQTRALISSIEIDSTTFYAPSATLSQPGVIRVHVQNGSMSGVSYVYVPGTSRFGLVNGGIGIIDSVPAGNIPSVCFVDMATPENIHTVKSDFILTSGKVTDIADYSLWKYSKKLFLNTTENGANVSGNVLNFPLLVRLSTSNFDFNQAKSDGSDLRFKKSNDSPVAYEIERWDPVKGLAEIWVKVDTVYGNDSTQFLTLYWGNSSASTESNSKAVFDTALGFQGVWHLAEEGVSITYDATANGYNGISYNMITDSVSNGAIGPACSFNGKSSYITMQNTASSKLNFIENGEYTMSLWAYTDTIDTIFHAIAGKGHEQYYMQLKCLGSNKATWEFVEFQHQRGWEYTQDSTPPAPGAKQWLYLVGVRSGTSQRLYINGELAVDSIALMPGSYDRNTGDDFSIGRYQRSVTIPLAYGFSYFKGKIDEVRVSGMVLSDSYIRLCYMNQKADDRLVRFKQ